MTRPALFRRLAVTLALAGAAAALPAAHADALAGGWKFETGVFDGDCTIVGNITFRPTSTPGRYSADFVSEENCDGGRRLKVRVRQTADAVMSGGQVLIRSTVKEVISRYPEGENTYLPDDFLVKPQADGKTMKGGFRSMNTTSWARFWREDDLTS